MEHVIEISVYWILFMVFIIMLLIFALLYLVDTCNKYYKSSSYYLNLYNSCNSYSSDLRKINLKQRIEISRLKVINDQIQNKDI